MNEAIGPISGSDRIAVSALTATTCVGHGLAPLMDALRSGRSGLDACRFRPFPGAAAHELATSIGEVEGVDDVVIEAALAKHDCRNNRLIELALRADDFAERVTEARARYGRTRVGVIVGTSTSGLLEAERAYFERDPAGRLPADFHYLETLNLAGTSSFIARRFDLDGPSYCISTACSSGAKTFAAAARLIRLGIIDAALVGGCDSLTLTTLHGFDSLQLLSSRPCRPFDVERDGISIGEGAAFALLERAAAAPQAQIHVAGWGESVDAYHMSSPHPEGLGAEIAMREALASAAITAGEVGYVNLHGTASKTNDVAEGLAVTRVFGEQCPSSSTKGVFGHLLGAAGAVEAAVTMLALENGLLPGTLNLRTKDDACPNRVLVEPLEARPRFAMSNSFGFGGSNCSVLFERVR